MADEETPEETPDAQQMSYGDWTIDFRTFQATHPQRDTVELTSTELAMLKLFARQAGEVITRDTFLEEVWGHTGPMETRTVDNFVRKLRQALEENPSHPRHIVSVRGAGYRFDP